MHSPDHDTTKIIIEMTLFASSTTHRASPSVVFFQSLFAIIVLGIVTITLLEFPTSKLWISAGLTIYFLLLWRHPWLWLIVVPTLLPVLDLTPSSGRIFFNEFDLLILVTAASGLLRHEVWIRPLQLNWKRWLLILLLIVWQGYTVLNGLFPIQPIDANAFTSYYSHYNGLRLAKGFFWALLLLPLLGQAIGRGNRVIQLFIFGMIGGLGADLIAILWERALFTGVFNFSKPYRVTALFSGMTTGGAPLDAHLIFSLPFLTALFLMRNSRLLHMLGFILLLFAIYGLAVTFSRADYAAVIVAIITGLLAWFYLKRHVESSHHGNGWYLGGVLLLALLISTPFISGEFIKHRFSTVSSDLAGRFVHWNAAIDMMGRSSENKLWGMGRGSFPRHYYWSQPVDSLPPTMLHIKENDNNFLRMDKSNNSGDLFLTQRFEPSEPGPYRLSISLRPRTEQATRLLIEICERLIYQSYKTCKWMGINTGTNNTEWVHFNKKFSINDLGKKYWYGSRPVQISILNRGLTEGIDIDNVQIITPSGKHLLNNSSFDNGLDHWFFYSGNHLGWHIKNIWVDTFFEGGWIGLAIFTFFIFYSLHISIKRLRNRDSYPLLYLPALTGLLIVGLFDSILDEPKLTLLLFLCSWILLTSRSTTLTLATTPTTLGITANLFRQFRMLTPTVRLGTIVIGLFVFIIIGIWSASRVTAMGPRQLVLRTLDKMGQRDGYLVQAVLPNHTHSEHKLIGAVRPSHPRILLPELSQWTGNGISHVMKQRIAQYSSYEKKNYLPCSSNSLPKLTSCWLSTGNPAKANQIINVLKTGYMQVARNNESYGNLWHYAFAYDFIRLYPDLKETDRLAIEAKIREALRHALLLLEGDHMSLWHGRATLSSIAWLAAIVLDPENPDDLNLISQAQGHFLETLKALAMTEAWPEGYSYWINNRAFLITLATSAYLNGLEATENHDQVLETLRRIGYWHIYNTRPDNKAHGIGDEGPRIDLKDETRRVIDLITQATKDPILAAYSNYLEELHRHASYYRGYRWGFSLFNDPSIIPTPPSTDKKTLSFAKQLPTAALFGINAMNMAYFRSGWSPTDTFITLRSGNNFTHHGHYDAGHFTLFKGAPLVSNSGTYGGYFSEHRLNYSLRTVSKNSLLILRKDEEVKPNRFFKTNVSDGGQRITMPTGSSIISTSQWAEQLNDGQHLEGGQLIAYDIGSTNSYRYLATDLTPAYNNTQYDETGEDGKVTSVVRELLYLVQADQLLIHDKIVSTDPSYTKKWLLHTINRPIMENTIVLKGTESNGILESRSDNLKIANGVGRLRVDRIYPEKAVSRLIGGPDYQYYVEMDGDDSDLNGKNMVKGVNKKPWYDDSQWRIEIQPEDANLEDHFLTVLTPSIDAFKNIKPSLLKTDHPDVYGTRSQDKVVIFLSELNEKSFSFTKKASDKTLFLVGLTPGSIIKVKHSKTESNYTVNSAGITIVKFQDPMGGSVLVSL